MSLKELIKEAQRAMNQKGAKLTEDGDPGPKTQAAMHGFDFEVVAKHAVIKPIESLEAPPWYVEAKKSEGKKETDEAFSKKMVSKWGLVGLKLKTIATSWAAWCGLFVAVSLAGVGIDHAKNGAAARNWGLYGVGIDWKTHGIPKGAIIHVNHASNCNSSKENHVTFADGNCAPADLLKKGASFNGYGGNQGNRAQVSGYPVADICAVRWPKEYPFPPKVTASVGCSGKPSNGESTR